MVLLLVMLDMLFKTIYYGIYGFIYSLAWPPIVYYARFHMRSDFSDLAWVIFLVYIYIVFQVVILS